MQALVALHEGMDPTGPADVHLHVPFLLQAVDLSSAPYVVDPWPSSHRQLTAILPLTAPHLVLLPLTPGTPLDHLQPLPYKQAQEADKLAYVVSAPLFHALDIILGLSALLVTQAAFVLAPITYISHAPGGRRRFLTRLSLEGRFRIALSMPVPPGQVQQVWICIFAQKEVQHRMIKATAA
jgi:hypothetical protein